MIPRSGLPGLPRPKFEEVPGSIPGQALLFAAPVVAGFGRWDFSTDCPWMPHYVPSRLLWCSVSAPQRQQALL